VSWRLAHEAKADEVTWLALDLLILLWAKEVVTGEVKVAEDSTCSGHHLLELLLLVPKVVLLFIVTFAVIIPLGLLEESSFFLLGQLVIKWVMSPHSKQPLGDLLLSLQNLCKVRNFLASRTISSSGMLLYCLSKAMTKEDKANSNIDETVVLVGLASWPPTRALVIKSLLVWEASWLGRSFLDSSWDFNLLNSFSISRVAKLADFSKAVIFIPHVHYQNKQEDNKNVSYSW
jgi:hypothetical protein